jgi:hypothetical protein
MLALSSHPEDINIMNRLLTIDCLPSQWTNDTLASLLSRFSGIRRSHMMANKDKRPLGFAIVEVAHPHQRESIIQALDGWIVGNHSIRVSRLDRSIH